MAERTDWPELERYLAGQQAAAADLLSELIRFPSIAGHGEGEIQRCLARYFADIGLDSRLKPVPEAVREHPNFTPCAGQTPYAERPNLYARLAGTGGGSVILCAHGDVVPAEDWPEAFQPRIEGDRVIGRGAVDDKGHIVAIYYALKALRELGVASKRDVEVQVVVEEEIGGNGALGALLDGHRADGVIVMESTGLEICPANRGALWYRLEMTGRPVHMGRIREGVNAIEKMALVMQDLRAYEQRLIAESRHPLFEDYAQPVQVNIGMIRGGDWPATVAGWAELEGGVGFLPGKEISAVEADIRRLLAESADPWVREHGRASFRKLRNDAYETDPADPLVTGLVDAARAAGLPGRVTGFIVSCDARLYARVGGMPTVVFGPGSIAQAHSRGESIAISEVLAAAGVLARFLAA